MVTQFSDRLKLLALPGIVALVALGILVWLGMWQVQRLAWKNDLSAQIQARAKAAPMTLEQVLNAWTTDKDVEYLRVQLKGQFLHDREQRLYGLRDGKAGWRVVTPLTMTGGRIALVDRGFVPLERELPETRASAQRPGTVEVVALVRKPYSDKGMFEADNQPAKRRWYWRDHDAMVRAALGDQAGRAVPFFLEAEARAVPDGWPKGGSTRLVLSNRHFEYALTWFGLAATLIGVFGVFAWQRLRAGGEHETP